ncbi:Carbohydrate-binding module family 1 protein [Rhizoctonia solani]|uniref:Carbohydrate-binding module family 1 protein n=1 Tax=Rhizoctonia solani TaxID=456999 RepID=A0A8H7I559_9AGAM|nr:Carbohydrate-binding module family 1 protein [Rhizoctonia solani]
MRLSVVISLAAAALARAGTVVWDGSFDPFNTPDDFNKWSWANRAGTYQYVGDGYTSYGAHGVNPEGTANLGTGNLFYHFSVKRSNTSAPNSALEHQVMFFESHFTELKYGVGSNPTDLQWFVSGSNKWSTPFVADTWFNFAYDIDFDAKTVGLWASTGGAPLTKVVQNIAANTFTVSVKENWSQNGTPKRGVYIESGPITTAIGSGSSNPPTTTSAPVTTTTNPPTTPLPGTTPAPTTSASAGTVPQWGQCGGTGYNGPTACISPYTCKAVSPPYYYQCL